MAEGTHDGDVVVIGAGPVGQFLTVELRRHGVDVVLLERRSAPGPGSRAIGLHPPVLAALEECGATERILAAAVRVRRGEARAERRVLGVVRFDRLPRRFPFVAALPQEATEAAIAFGQPEPRRGWTATRVEARGSETVVHTDRGEVRGKIVVLAGGAGGRGLLYRAEAIRVREYRDRYLMSDVAVGSADATAIVRLGPAGVLESFPLPGGRRRFVAWDARPDDDAPDRRVGRLQQALAAQGLDEEAARISEASGFRVRRAIAPRLRRGSVLAIGDAAHEVSPIGGQGMNLGLLDASTLAPLLALWIRRADAPEAALATWERRRIASARIAAAIASANTALGRPLPAGADGLRRAALRVALRPPGARLLAHAYAMGFDRERPDRL